MGLKYGPPWVLTTGISRRSKIYAVIRAGGKQYRVEREQLLDVDLMDGDVGSTVEIKDVLLIANNGDVSVGTPTVEGAVVEAEIVEHGRGPKLRIFKYKNKTRYRRRIGHRTDYTRLEVKRILQDGKEAIGEKEKPKKRTAKRAGAKTKAVEATSDTSVDATAEAEAKPKRTTRKSAPKKTEEAPPIAGVEASAEAPTADPETEPKAKPKTTRRATAKKSADKTAEAAPSAEEANKPTKRRTTRAKAEKPADEDKPADDKGADE